MSVNGSNVGIVREWGSGFDGWDGDMDRNLLLLDAMAFGRVKSIGSNTAPGSPSAGDAHIVGDSPTGAWGSQAAALAVYDGTAWQFAAVHVSWVVHCEADNGTYQRTNTGWRHVYSVSDAGVISFPSGISFGDEALGVYDEGTWTPALTGETLGGTGSPTYTGRYTRIGRLVHWLATVSPGTSTFASTLFTTQITNLPFTAATGTYPLDGYVFSGIAYPKDGFVTAGSAYLPTSSAQSNDIHYTGLYQV